MRRLRNTLYVLTQGSYLAKEGDGIIQRIGSDMGVRLPFVGLESVVCFGTVSVSPPLMHALAEAGVGLSFLSEQGRFLARVQGPVSGNVLLRREQYRAADSEKRTAELARAIVLGKVLNCRTVLRRALRDGVAEDVRPAFERATARMAQIVEELPAVTTVDRIRGFEGEAASYYFGVFNGMISSQREHFVFTQRSRRPPLDPVNALLSFLYSMLRHDMTSALEAVGLDPAVGFLHTDRPGRPGLALDLMEELRPILADRVALTLINRREVKPDGFEQTESGAIRMTDDTRKIVISAYQTRKREIVEHPILEERVEWGLIPHVQSLLLARHIRGDLEGYPPFVWK